MKPQRYFSGLSVFDYAFYDPPPFIGKGWNISYEELDYLKREGLANINGFDYPSKAVIINANSIERDQCVSELLYASNCLVNVDLPFIPPHKVRQIDENNATQETLFAGESYGGVSLVCMIAAKASFRKEYQYALFKHLASHELISSESIDHDPAHWSSRKFVYFSADYHVKCAYAIVLAYSAIEELSLELRSSNKTPSFINGSWNPIVKIELERRLLKAGINLADPFLLELRDTPTKLERTRQPKIISKSSWAYRKIRDGEIEIVDALARASWLRSKVSAHKLGDLATSLNFYEVANIQYLARRLLLEKLGFWRYYDSK